MFLRMLNAMIAGLLHGLVTLLKLPVEVVARLFGAQSSPTAADVAEEALAAVAASPKVAPIEPAVKRKPCPVAELLAEYARKLVSCV